MPPSPHLQAVAFDLDGLMFNTEELYREVGAELLRRRGKTITTDLLNAMMGRPGRVALKTMIDWHGLSDSVADLQHETSQIFPAILDARLAPMPGLLALLDALEKQGIPKSVATSSGRAFVDDVLARFELAPRFAFLLTSEDVTSGKPHPEIYQTAAERFGVDPGGMLVLEDSQAGCRAAVAAGAHVIAVPGDHSRDHDFSGAALVADGLTDERIYQALGCVS